MVALTKPYRFLRGTRNRPLLPHRMLAPLREMLVANAEIARAFATHLDGDERWNAAADALDAAADAIRRVLVAVVGVVVVHSSPA